MKKTVRESKVKKVIQSTKDFRKFAGILKGDVIGELMKEKQEEKKL